MIRKIIRTLIYFIFIIHWLKTCNLTHKFYGFINPFSLFSASTILIEDVAFALMFFIILALIFLGRLRIDKKVMWALLIFFASGVMLLAYSFSLGNNDLLAHFRLYAFCFMGIAFWFSFTKWRHLLNFVRVIVVIFCIDTWIAFIHNITSLYVSKVYLNEMLTPFGVILSVMILKCKRRFSFLYYAVLCTAPLTVLNILLSGSRSTYLYIGVFMTLIFIMNFKRIKSIVCEIKNPIRFTGITMFILLVTAVLGFMINYDFIQQFQKNIYKAYNIESTAYARMVAWKILLGRISERPFLGHGLGAKGAGIGKRISDGINPNRKGVLMGSAHNALLILTYQIGGIGIIVLGLFLYHMLWQIRKTRKFLPDGFKFISNIMISGIVAYLCEVSFHPLGPSFHYYLWYYLGIIIAVLRISRDHETLRSNSYLAQESRC